MSDAIEVKSLFDTLDASAEFEAKIQAITEACLQIGADTNLSACDAADFALKVLEMLRGMR